MDPSRSLWVLLCSIALIRQQVSSQTFRIPDSGDTCNVVNLNFGRGDDNLEQNRGPQGPQGKRGSPGLAGVKGQKGEVGEVGPRGITPTINFTALASSVIKAVGATSCEELMKVHGMTQTGYYLMRSNVTKHPVYTYCDFQLREGMRTCQQLKLSLGDEMKSGYFLTDGEQGGDQTFLDCQKEKVDCKDVYRGDALVRGITGGVFDIFPLPGDDSIRVYCDLEVDGGGWIVFQRRMDGSVDFYRDWSDYVKGFGRPDGEFWLGLENLHQITQTGPHELRIDLTDWSGNSVYAKYGTFAVGSRNVNYRLDVGGYDGTAGDSMSPHNNTQFSTKDADHDTASGSCAKLHHGAWWYIGCYNSNLNGKYHQGPGNAWKGVVWYNWKNNNEYLKFVEMKLRKKS